MFPQNFLKTLKLLITCLHSFIRHRSFYVGRDIIDLLSFLLVQELTTFSCRLTMIDRSFAIKVIIAKDIRLHLQIVRSVIGSV